MANADIDVLEADGTTTTTVKVLDVGRQAAAASKSLALSTEDKTVLDAVAASVDTLETLIASTNTKLDTAITALQIIDNMTLAAGTANIGDVDVLTVPADPFGVNADVASVTGSISAKLRALATAVGTGVLTRGAGNVDSTTLRVAIGTDQLDGSEYETVAASATTQSMGATGAVGDYLRAVVIVPGTTSPGAVAIKDGSNTAITIFTGGATSVSNLVPFVVDLGLTSVQGAWQITTGTNVTAIGVGNFT